MCLAWRLSGFQGIIVGNTLLGGSRRPLVQSGVGVQLLDLGVLLENGGKERRREVRGLQSGR